MLLTSTDNPDFQVSRWLVFSFGIVTAVFFAVIIGAIAKTRNLPNAMGGEAMIGQAATARSAIDPEGYVFLRGERWKARTEDGPIAEGERVTITGAKGLTLTVRQGPAPPPV